MWVSYFLIYMGITKLNEVRLKEHKGVLIISGLFGLLNASGMYLYRRDALPKLTVIQLALFFAYAVVYAIAFLLVWKVFEYCASRMRVGVSASGVTDTGDLAGNIWDRHTFLICFLAIMAGWAIWIISYYPASMEWDVYDPIRQYIGQTTPTDHHPWFYVCVVGAAYSFGEKIGDKNVGIFIYMIIRDLIMAAIYARCVVMLHRHGLKKRIVLLVLAFYSITPVWGAYAKHAFKDAIGAALFCWFIEAIVLLVLDKMKHEQASVGICAEIAIASLLACLFRHNNFYAICPVLILAVIIILKKEKSIKTAVLLLSGLILFSGYHYYIINIEGITPTSMGEALAIPLQQTARTVKYDSDST